MHRLLSNALTCFRIVEFSNMEGKEKAMDMFQDFPYSEGHTISLKSYQVHCSLITSLMQCQTEENGHRKDDDRNNGDIEPPRRHSIDERRRSIDDEEERLAKRTRSQSRSPVRRHEDEIESERDQPLLPNKWSGSLPKSALRCQVDITVPI